MAHEFLGIVLHIFEHLFNRFTINDLIDVVGAVLYGNMYRIGISKQVVHIAQNLLIGTHEEDAKVVVLILLQRVNRQRMRVVAVGHEVGNLTIRVAGDILYGSITRGTLIESLDRHDGEQLVNSPRVTETLE